MFRIPKTQIKYLSCINVRRSRDFVSRGNLRWRLQTETCYCKSIPSPIIIRKIHVTEPRRALPPLLILLLRPIWKIMTILTGRFIRVWWKNLSPEEKQAILKKVREKKFTFATFGSFGVILLTLYYYDHFVETPLTKRKRFVMFNDDVISKIGKALSSTQLEMYKHQIVPPGHRLRMRVERVVNRIIGANADIPELTKIPWLLAVVDQPDLSNACCFSDGTILVFTGMLHTCSNDDQLAIVLSHEISHIILSHQAENISKMYFVEILLLIPSFIFWILFTDIWALMSDWVTQRIANVLIHLPFSRLLEREADMVGLLLAARACFDVREAPVFWAKMSVTESSAPHVEWLSTHPTSEARMEESSKILPVALELRNASSCPKLRD